MVQTTYALSLESLIRAGHRDEVTCRMKRLINEPLPKGPAQVLFKTYMLFPAARIIRV